MTGLHRGVQRPADTGGPVGALPVGHSGRFFLCLLLFLVWVGPASEAREPRSAVILISMDGTRPKDVTPEVLPSLAAISQRGAVAERLVPAFPSNTFPNHVTLVTGVAPERHGIVNNDFIDPARGRFEAKDIPDWIEVEPLWSLLARHGIVSASYFWVGSEGPWRSGRGPSKWVPFSESTTEKTKVEQILAWLEFPEPERPRFITSWFHGADHAGHQYGPGSEQVRASLRSQNQALSRLIGQLEERALFKSTTLIVVSDHGMAPAAHRVDLSTALYDAGVGARVLGIGGSACVYLNQLGPELPTGSTSNPRVARVVEVATGLGLAAVARDLAPASMRVGHRRFGDVVVTAPLGTAIVRPDLDLLGFHGYDPDSSSMAGIFLALGRGARPGTRIPAVRASDVAPTVLALLGVEVPDWMEGRPIAELLADADPEESAPGSGDPGTPRPGVSADLSGGEAAAPGQRRVGKPGAPLSGGP